MGHGERGAPGTADDEPARDAEVLAHMAQVVEQVVGGVVIDRTQRPAATGAALVDADDAKAGAHQIIADDLDDFGFVIHDEDRSHRGSGLYRE